MFQPEAWLEAIGAVPFVSGIIARDETVSTNDDALRAAREGAAEGVVVVADRQTAGRGRLGRTWWSEPGTALLVSWIVRPVDAAGGRDALPVERWTVLPLLAGLAAAEGIGRACGLDVGLKWPNDLMVAGRKLGGILVEAEPPRFAVVGLGVNVGATEFPEEIRETATSVVAAGGRSPGRATILAAVLATFEEALAAPQEALVRYRARCASLGREVRVERAGAPPLEGTARDVDARGALVIEAGGEQVVVPAGDVVHLR